MDPNLLYWKTQRQSFLRRLETWFNLLDPTLLLSSDDEIQKARTLLESGQNTDKKGDAAVILSLSSIHADSGNTLPVVFRAPAVYPISAPLIIASLLPHNLVRHTLFWQFMVQSYNAGFTFANRNSSSEKQKNLSLTQLLLLGGTVSYTTCAGALPQILMNRLSIRSPPVQTFFRSVLSVPLYAALAYFNVVTVRSEESNDGIQVFDYNGNPLGFSRAAGEKAVRETALSRAAMFGVTAAVPNVLLILLQRSRLFQRNPFLSAPFRHISVALVLGLMVPVSFSLFPQLGTIKREELEEELQAAAVGQQIFYHRGL